MKLILACCGLFILSVHAVPARGNSLEKLSPEHLEAVRQSVMALQQQRGEIPRTGDYQEHRANLHVHSHWSHDSEGTVEEIVAAEQRVGTTVLMFTEHSEATYDFFVDGNQGIKDGVLMIPGAEMEGLLVYPTMSLRGVTPTSSQELADLVQGRNGQLFVSHLEERMDWQIEGVTGVEMYNTHADFKEEKGMISALKNPFRMLSLASMVRQYPQESFAALQKYPARYLKRFDELCAIAPHTGFSANDAHQNVGFVVRWIADDKAQLEDALGEKLLDLSLSALADSEALLKDKKPGDVVFDMFLDRYENSLRHVAAHLLLTEHSDTAVRECLDAGRAFVAFDWIADSRGFDFAAIHGTSRHEMGSQISLVAGTSLKARAPLPVHWRLVRNGEIVQEADGQEFSASVFQPGSYRCEAWLDVAEERTIWILSNPIYFQSP